MKNKKVLMLVLVETLVLMMFLNGCVGRNSSDEKNNLSEEAKNTKVVEPEPKPEPKEETYFGNLNTFTADTIDGETFNQNDLSDKDLTVMNFWSVTCGPCVMEMPDLAKLQKALPDNVQLLTVCLDGVYGKDDAQFILDETEFTGKTLIDWEGDAVDVFEKIQYTPTTLFFDKDGNAVGDVIVGGQGSETYLDAINSALRGMGKDEISIEK